MRRNTKTQETVSERFDTINSQIPFNEYDNIPRRFHHRDDINAFLLLDSLSPINNTDIIAAAEHDIIYFDFDIEEYEWKLSEQDIKELIVCGVFVNYDSDGLAMFK